MIIMISSITTQIITEQILAAGGWVSLTLAFYPLYKESVKIRIERSNNRLKNTVYSPELSISEPTYAASVIDSFLNFLNGIRRKNVHDGILITGIAGSVVLFFAYLHQRRLIGTPDIWTYQTLHSHLFEISLFIIILQTVFAIRLVILIGSPHTFTSEELEEFIEKM